MKKSLSRHSLFCLLVLATCVVLVQCSKNDGPAPNPVQPAPFKILDSAQMVTDLQQLSSDAFKGRKADYPEISLAHQLIQSRLRQAGMDSFAVGLAQDFTLGASGVQHKNLLGFIRGTQMPNEYIVMGAHYDHMGVNASGDVYNGADDNASGVAAVLAAAKYFKAHPPKHSIIFALWAAEELGLKGSQYFTNNLPAGITLPAIKFNLNMDMIARSDNNKIWAAGLFHYPSFSYLVDSLQGKTTVQLLSGFDNAAAPQDWTYQSDHGSFHQKGIPFLYLGVEDHPDYHRVTDEFNRINLGRYVENANIAAQMMLLLDRKL